MDSEFTEYRVRPVTRFIVTKFCGVKHANGNESGSCASQIGPEYANEDIAFEVGYALARQEAERLGCGPGDCRVIYPTRPSEENCTLAVSEGRVHRLTTE